jgi:hypothetical protein
MGTATTVALQRRLRERQLEFARTPHLVNGGRIMHVLEPEEAGWDLVRTLVAEDKIVGFPVVMAEPTIDQINQHLGPNWQISVFEVFLGKADRVLAACDAVVEAYPLPVGWHLSMHDYPNEQLITEVQTLNAETGVGPYPAYYMRSEAVPVLTACLHDDGGKLVATASVADRYPSGGRLSGHVFAGMVSVSADRRRMGLGKLIKANALLASQKCFGWQYATEQIEPENTASRAMILACGLDRAQDLASIVADID